MSTMRQKVAVYLGLTEDYRDEFDYDDHRDRDAVADRGHDDIAVEQVAPATPATRARRVDAAYDVVRFSPSAYADVAPIGEAFRSGDVISMDLSGLSGEDAKRMIDFASGLTFGLSGRIERLGGKVFLLTPKGVEVTSSVRSSLIP
jgi:cell division inhibitor SepF